MAVLRARQRPFVYTLEQFRGITDNNPSQGVLNDVETLTQRLRREAERAGISTTGLEIRAVKVPDAAAGIVAVVKRMFNVDVRFVGIRGIFGPLNFDGADIVRNTLYVNVESHTPFAQVIGHEFLHYLRHAAPDLYEQFSHWIKRSIDMALFDQGAAEEAKHYAHLPAETDREQMGFEEMRAEIFGDVWGDPVFWETLAAEDNSLADKVLGLLRRFLNRIKAMLSGSPNTHMRASLYKDFDAIRNVTLNVTKQFANGGYMPYMGLATTRYINAAKRGIDDGPNDDGPKGGIAQRDRPNIDTALRRMDKFVAEFESGRLKDSDTQILGRTPTVLQALGEKDLPLQIDGATVRKVLDGKHKYDLNPDILRQVPEGIYNPLLVFKSATGSGKVLVTELASRNGKPVVAAIHFEKRHGGMVVNDISSIHEKTDAERAMTHWINDGLLEYARNENDLFGSATRHPLPASVTDLLKGHVSNVAQDSGIINSHGAMFSRGRYEPALSGMIDVDGALRPTTNSEGRPIHPTQEGASNFQRWFGSSKVVDADGNPLVMHTGASKDVDFASFKVPKNGVPASVRSRRERYRQRGQDGAEEGWAERHYGRSGA